MDSLDPKIQLVLEKFPFLSYGTFDEKDFIGIIQNADNQLLSMYVLDEIPTEEMRAYFVKCGEEWWWESNRKIPINIFLKDKFTVFRNILKHFNRKDFVHVSGPIVSLEDMISKRVRKRQITLIKKL